MRTTEPNYELGIMKKGDAEMITVSETGHLPLPMAIITQPTFAWIAAVGFASFAMTRCIKSEIVLNRIFHSSILPLTYNRQS